jgi:hypothetical protein
LKENVEETTATVFGACIWLSNMNGGDTDEVTRPDFEIGFK